MDVYKLLTTIKPDGTIILPSSLKELFSHKVEITFEEKETSEIHQNISDLLDKITKEYAQIQEPEIDVTEIYSLRNQIDDREISIN